MNEDHVTGPGVLTRIGWFFWRNWNRLACATRGHDLDENQMCRRCGLPVATWPYVMELEAEIGRLNERLELITENRAYLSREVKRLRAEA